jgi:DNA primase
MNISQAVDEIKNQIDIVDFLSRYLDLKRAGRNYKALCPFHSEKTPSFVVNPEKQFFHCFGCGVGGDIITFMMRYEGVGFLEAVKMLAEKAGIKIETSAVKPSTSVTRRMLLSIHQRATEFFREQLQNSSEAKGYLKRRGLSDEIINTFMLGYAPSGGDLLYKYLINAGYTEGQILHAGVCKKTEDGVIMDMFRRRIVFPITSIRGEIIAFGGRVVSEEQLGPKYINSPESPIFKKSSELFGLYQAKDEVKKKGYVILMEGYLDVLTSHQFGLTNTVAPLGTSLTEAQVRRLKTLTDKVLLVFDSDEAGLKASKRALALCYQVGITAKVLSLPEGEDPDTFLRKYGVEGLKKLFSETKDIIDFYFSVQEKEAETVRELIEIIAEIRDSILKGSLLKRVSEKTGISEQFLIEEVRRYYRFPKSENRVSDRGVQTKVIVPDAEETIIAIFASHPEYSELISGKLSPDMFEKPLVKTIYLKLTNTTPETFLNDVLEEEEMSFLSSLIVSLKIDKEELEETIMDCIKKIRAKSLRRRITELQAWIKEAEKEKDQETLIELQQRFLSIIKEGRSEGIL